MKIEHMRLENFRQFKGKQEIAFSTDARKNVTVVMGDNGAGKTTLAQAFLWCLYGKTSFKYPEVINREVREFDLHQRGCKVMVEILLSHQGSHYNIVRRKYYFADGKINEQFEVRTQNENGDWKTLNEIASRAKVKDLLPYELSSFFFFDGERIERMSEELLEQKRSKAFKEAVQGLVGMRPIYEAIEHLGVRGRKSTVIGKINAEISEDAGATIQDFDEEIEKLDGDIARDQAAYEQADEERARFERAIGEVNKELQEMQTGIKNRREYETFQHQADVFEKRIREEQAKLFHKFAKESGAFFLQPLLQEALEELKGADQLEKGIPHVQADTIHCLLERGRCICGAPLSHDKEKIRCLQELLKAVPPNSIGQMIGMFAREARAHAERGKDFFEEIRQMVIDIRNDEQERNHAHDEMRLLEGELSDTSKVKKLQQRRSEAEMHSRACKSHAAKAYSLKQEHIMRKNMLETKRMNFLAQNKRNLKNLRYLHYAEKVARQLRDAYAQKETETRERLEETINHIFETIYDGGIELSVSSDYLIHTHVTDTLVQTKKDDLEQNTAQSYAIIFAFISGIIELAKEPDAWDEEHRSISRESYPLVMDAPLSSFDKSRIGRICKELPEIAEQVIIIIKDTDGETAEQYLNDRIGEKWKLTAENKTHTTIEGRG